MDTTRTATTPDFITTLHCSCGDCPNCDALGIRVRYPARAVALAAWRAGHAAVGARDDNNLCESSADEVMALAAREWDGTYADTVGTCRDGELGELDARRRFVGHFAAVVWEALT
jgi:hypothetical protein